MHYNDLPERWKEELTAYLSAKYGDSRNRLSAYDFIQSSTSIDFEDGSSLTFNYTLSLKSDDFNEVAVFTEHCGYHIFSLDSIESITDNNT